MDFSLGDILRGGDGGDERLVSDEFKKLLSDFEPFTETAVREIREAVDKWLLASEQLNLKPDLISLLAVLNVGVVREVNCSDDVRKWLSKACVLGWCAREVTLPSKQK